MADQIGNVTGQVRTENSPAQIRMQDRPGGVDDPAQMARFFCLQTGDDGPVKVIAGKRLVPLAGQDGLTPFIQYVSDASRTAWRDFRSCQVSSTGRCSKWSTSGS